MVFFRTLPSWTRSTAMKTSKMMSYEAAAKQVHQAARTAAYHKGAGFTYADVRAMCVELPARFICEQAELAGFPCWTSAPDEAWNPYWP